MTMMMSIIADDDNVRRMTVFMKYDGANYDWRWLVLGKYGHVKCGDGWRMATIMQLMMYNVRWW